MTKTNYFPLQFFLAFLLVLPISAAACSVVEEPTLPERYADATTIVLAKVVSTKIGADPTVIELLEYEYVEATIQPIEYFKGQKLDPPMVVELVYGPGNCTLGLLAGLNYLIFLYDDIPYVGWPGGSFMIWNIEGTEVKPVLEELRTLRDGATHNGS